MGINSGFKGLRRKWPNLREYSAIYLEGVTETTKFNRDSWFPNRESKAVSPKSKSQSSPFEPIYYVRNMRSGTNYDRRTKYRKTEAKRKCKQKKNKKIKRERKT